jgi:molecular chaperone DnaJ
MCRVVVETPINLTKKQKELLTEFQEIQESQGNKQSPRRSNWFDGVKKFVDALKS